MNDRVKRGRNKDREIFAAASFQDPQDQSTKKCFLNEGNDNRGGCDFRECMPTDPQVQGENVESNQYRAAAEQGDHS